MRREERREIPLLSLLRPCVCHFCLFLSLSFTLSLSLSLSLCVCVCERPVALVSCLRLGSCCFLSLSWPLVSLFVSKTVLSSLSLSLSLSPVFADSSVLLPNPPLPSPFPFSLFLGARCLCSRQQLKTRMLQRRPVY